MSYETDLIMYHNLNARCNERAAAAERLGTYHIAQSLWEQYAKIAQGVNADYAKIRARFCASANAQGWDGHWRT